MHLLDYVLPQVANLSKTLQTENLEITAISIHLMMLSCLSIRLVRQ